MAIIVVPAKTATVVSAGTANDLIIANGGSSPMALNLTDPSTAGAALYLGNQDSVVMAAGGAFAAAQWVAWSNLGTIAVVIEP